MKRKEKSSYNFAEAIKSQKSDCFSSDTFAPDVVVADSLTSHKAESPKPHTHTKKVATATPFIDNFDLEFREPDFKLSGKASSDPFDNFKAQEEFENPFDSFKSHPVEPAPQSTDILEHVLNSGFLSARDAGAKSVKTPFD